MVPSFLLNFVRGNSLTKCGKEKIYKWHQTNVATTTCNNKIEKSPNSETISDYNYRGSSHNRHDGQYKIKTVKM